MLNLAVNMGPSLNSSVIEVLLSTRLSVTTTKNSTAMHMGMQVNSIWLRTPTP